MSLQPAFTVMKPTPAPTAALRIATDAMRAPFANWLRQESSLLSEPDSSRRRSCSLEAICARLSDSGHLILGPITSPAIRIDRIVIGPSGALALQAWGAPDGLVAGARVRVDADGVSCDGQVWGQNLLARARVCASYLRTLLEDAPGWRARQPVLVAMLFEGCVVEQTPQSRNWVWALESGAFEPTLEARLATLLAGGGRPFDAVAIAAIAQRLEQHIGARAELR